MDIVKIDLLQKVVNPVRGGGLPVQTSRRCCGGEKQPLPGIDEPNAEPLGGPPALPHEQQPVFSCVHTPHHISHLFVGEVVPQLAGVTRSTANWRMLRARRSLISVHSRAHSLSSQPHRVALGTQRQPILDSHDGDRIDFEFLLGRGCRMDGPHIVSILGRHCRVCARDCCFDQFPQ